MLQTCLELFEVLLVLHSVFKAVINHELTSVEDVRLASRQAISPVPCVTFEI